MAVFACAGCGTVLTSPVSQVVLPAHAHQRYGHDLPMALSLMRSVRRSMPCSHPGRRGRAWPWPGRACPPRPRTSPWFRGIRRPGRRGRPARERRCRWLPMCGCIWPSTAIGDSAPRRAGYPRASIATTLHRCCRPSRSGPTEGCSSTRWPGCRRFANRGFARSTTARRTTDPVTRSGGRETSPLALLGACPSRFRL